MPTPKKPTGPRPTLVKDGDGEIQEVIENHPREDVYDHIDDSRDRQVAQFGNEHDDALPHERWISLLAQRLGDVSRAADEVEGSQPDRLRRALFRYRTALIELLATGTAAVEAHDRTLDARMEVRKMPFHALPPDGTAIALPIKDTDAP